MAPRGFRSSNLLMLNERLDRQMNTTRNTSPAKSKTSSRKMPRTAATSITRGVKVSQTGAAQFVDDAYQSRTYGSQAIEKALRSERRICAAEIARSVAVA